MASPLISSELLSRAGKSSTQRFKILKNKDGVLRERQTRKFVPGTTSLHSPAKEEISKEALEELIAHELNAMQKEAQASEKDPAAVEKQLLSPVFKSQDREGFYKALSRKDKIPPCGHYNVSYAQVDSQSSLPPVRKSVHDAMTPPPEVHFPPAVREPRSPPAKPPSPPPMSLQLARKPLLSLTIPHENRFLSLDLMPPHLTKYRCELCRRPAGVNMARSLPRPDYTAVNVNPDYYANREILMTDLSKSPSFQKMRSRPPLFPTTPSPVSQCDINLNSFKKKSSAVDFSKSRPREKSPHLPLPAYMQDSCNRFSVGSFSEKTIKLNCTKDSVLAPAPNVMDFIRSLHFMSLRSARSSS